MATIEMKQMTPRPVLKLFFGRSESARSFTREEKDFVLRTLNDPRAFPFQWVVQAKRPDWIVTLEDQDHIDQYDPTVRGLSVTFMSERPVSMLSLQNWETVPAALNGQYSRSDYCRYLLLHECGHALGLHHARVCGPQGFAPIMIQQTKGLGSCAKNTWPLAKEQTLASQHMAARLKLSSRTR